MTIERMTDARPGTDDSLLVAARRALSWFMVYAQEVAKTEGFHSMANVVLPGLAAAVESANARREKDGDPPEPLTESRARELIRAVNWESFSVTGDTPPCIWMEGRYTADELEAFAWWLRNKPGEEP